MAGRRFEGKTVWITGGGSGLGRALAVAFAQEGARVAVSGRRVDRLDETVAAIEAAQGEGVAIPCDVVDEAAQADAVAAVVARFGGLDVVIANAGCAVVGRVDQLDAEAWRRQLDINVVGVAITARAALPELRKTGGRLALIGSVSSMITTPAGGPYSASKAAVRAMGQALSIELHGSGVTCTTIHPGFVESEISKVDNSGTFHADKPDRRPAKLMWRSDRAAQVMLAAIHARKREFVFTGHGKIAAWLGRHTPSLIHFAMTRGAAKKGAEAIADSKR